MYKLIKIQRKVTAIAHYQNSTGPNNVAKGRLTPWQLRESVACVVKRAQKTTHASFVADTR